MRAAAGVLLFIGAALLAGCGGGASGPGSHAGPSRSSSGPTQGYYKVGQPYQIDGVTYTPAVDYSYDETGIASWYGPNFTGKITANGELYDMNEVTAAHRTLPMPSLVRVTNLDNGRTIVVRVNDRGPYARGRILDMSRRGAQLLGYEKTGTAKVRVQILARESMILAAAAKQGQLTVAAEVAEWAPTPIGAVFKDRSAEVGPWQVYWGCMGEQLPHFDNQVALSRETDRWGMPLAVLDAQYRENEERMIPDILATSGEMAEAAGFRDIKVWDNRQTIGLSIHEMGTARMGRDPKTSVLNGTNQVHAVPNVFVTDGACMTSSAWQNPSLTYMAITARAAHHAVEELKRRNL